MVKPRTVAIAGLGAIGAKVANTLDANGIPGLLLVAVSGRDIARTRAAAAALQCRPAVLTTAALAENVDIVVDCAPSAVFADLARATVEQGKILVSVNAGALLQHLDLVETAKRTGGRILVPTGALLGLDAVRAAAEGMIHSVTMITRKPPNGLEGAPYLVRHGISLAGLNAPKRVFQGSAAEGARGFPANVNVAAALGLSGIGPERTSLEIWADPGVDRNIHRIEVEADSARFSLQIENVPSMENPRTGKITALSVLACLRGMVSPLRVGT